MIVSIIIYGLHDQTIVVVPDSLSLESHAGFKVSKLKP
jgi:hypothetical protein